MRQLLDTMFISNSRALFYLCWKQNLVKRQKVSKYYKNDCKRPYFDTRGRQTCFTKLVLAWNFLILIEYFNTEGLSLVAVRMEYLFAYQFWYLELWVENLSGGEGEALFCWFFPAEVLLMLVGEGSCGWLYASVCSYKFRAFIVYLHATSTGPTMGGAFGIQSNICGAAFLQKYSRPLAIFAEELHRVSLTRCLTRF